MSVAEATSAVDSESALPCSEPRSFEGLFPATAWALAAAALEFVYLVLENLLLPVGRGHVLLVGGLFCLYWLLTLTLWGIARLLERQIPRLRGIAVTAPAVGVLSMLAASHYRMRVNTSPRDLEGTLVTLGILMLGGAMVLVGAAVVRSASERVVRWFGLGGVLLLVVALGFFLVRWRGLEKGATLTSTRESRVLEAGGIESTGKKVLLIGLDGGDWKVMDPLLRAGKLPNLESLIEQGSAADFESLEPTYSPVIWTTIAAGTRPTDHRILDHSRSPMPLGLPDSPVQLRSLAALSKPASWIVQSLAKKDLPRYAQTGHVQSARVWDVLDSLGMPTIVMDWYVSHPASSDHGAMISDRHFVTKSLGPVEGTVAPPELEESIEGLVLGPEDISPELLGSFLDADDLSNDAIEEFVASRPDVFTSIRTELARNETTRNLLGPVFESTPDWRFAAVYFRAMDIAHHLAWTPHEEGQSGGEFADDDSRRLAPVVNRYYEYSDRLLGDVLEQADDDTVVIVVSDHGWESAEAQHYYAPDGFLVIAGPDVKRAAERSRSSVYEVAPLVMSLLGLPVARDLVADVPTQLMSDGFWLRHPVRRLASYEIEGEGGPVEDVEMDAETIEYLKSLGYL
ncbi:MAG: alkaline phosphatase family protein [Acidobacteriota bacterium]